MTRRQPPSASPEARRGGAAGGYGVVVDSVKVSVFA
jgi:hypothetical protein